MKKFLCLILFFVSFLIPAICKNSDSFFWKKSIDGKILIWTDNEKDFAWIGNNIDGFANGFGTLQFYENGKKTLTFRFEDFCFGAKKNDFCELNGTGDLYIGEGSGKNQKKLPNGKGVLFKKNQNVYVGNFKNGKIEGFASRYKIDNKKNQLIYKGNFKNNVYEGEGELFENGNLVYKGKFAKGKREGEGIEYQNSFAFIGNFTKDEKNGLFKIEGHNINREVSFKNNIPEISNAKVSYQSGVEWQGELDNRLNPTNEGKVIYPNGDFYEGEVENNRRDGFGKFTSDFVSYEGEWVEDKCSGYGDAVFGDDWFYSGSWNENAFDGFGVLNAGNYKYSGDWKNGKKDGYGTLIIQDARFDGQFKDDKINGEGTISYPNGDFYSGEWVDSHQEGYGEYFWKDGTAYFGDWEDDAQNGEGTLYLSNGDIYSGDFEDGKYDGKGVFIHKSGDKYEGSFKNNLKSGKGRYYFANGDFYEGDFFKDKIEGTGKLNFKNGNYYEGKFKSGIMNGTGSLYMLEENNSYSVLTSNYWKGSTFPTKGTIVFSNGDEFSGILKDGKPTEEGVWRRNGEKTKQEKAYRFYKENEETIKSIVSTTQLVLAGVSIAGDIVGAVALVPCPPLAGVAFAVSKVADIANASISGLSIIVGTSVLVRESSDAKVINDKEEISRLRKEYFKEQIWNVADVALTFGSMAFKSIKAGKIGKATKVGKSTRTAYKSKYGVEAISKLGGKIPDAKSVRIAKRSKLVNLDRLNNKVVSMRAKGKITLSKKEIEWIKKSPKVNLRAMIKSKTGKKTFGEGFQEFFIRLSDGDSKQVAQLMDIPEIKKTVNKAIRGGGGVHEWLMTKNYTDFLTNAKWGDDGAVISLALTDLVQDTRSVAFKNGGTHFDKMNSGKFHQGLAKVIDSSNSADDLLKNVKKYAEGALTKESFEGFMEIFERCFSKI